MYKTLKMEKSNYDYLMVMLYNEFNHEYDFRMDTGDTDTEHLEALYSIIADLEPKSGLMAITTSDLLKTLRNKIKEVENNGCH